VFVLLAVTKTITGHTLSRAVLIIKPRPGVMPFLEVPASHIPPRK